LLSGKNVVTDRNVVDENALKFVGLRAQNLVLLKSFKVFYVQITDNWFGSVSVGGFFSFFKSELGHGSHCLLSRGFWIRL